MPTGISYDLKQSLRLQVQQPAPPPKPASGVAQAAFNALAAIFARVSLAIYNAELQTFILTATGGKFSAGTVLLTPPPPGPAAQPVPAGTVLIDENGRRFIVTQASVLDPAMGPVDVAVQSVRLSYQSGLPTGAVLDWGPTTPAALVALTATTADPYFAGTVASPITGGLPAGLDLIGKGRALPRQAAESGNDPPYRTRLRRPLDLVTPTALLDIANRLLAPYNITATLMEDLGPGPLPPPDGYNGVLGGFLDADPVPSTTWTAAAHFAVGEGVTPTLASTKSYLRFVAQNSGVTGGVEPNWPTATGATVVDGTITWKSVQAATGLWYFDQGLGPYLQTEPTPGATTQLGTLGPSNESDETSRAFFRLSMPFVMGIDPGRDRTFCDTAPYPPAGFADQSFTGAGKSPTSIIAAAIWAAINAAKAGGVGFEIVFPQTNHQLQIGDTWLGFWDSTEQEWIFLFCRGNPAAMEWNEVPPAFVPNHPILWGQGWIGFWNPDENLYEYMSPNPADALGSLDPLSQVQPANTKPNVYGVGVVTGRTYVGLWDTALAGGAGAYLYVYFDSSEHPGGGMKTSTSVPL